MTLEEMIPLAQQGVKMTHRYFTNEEWLILRGNVILFEDGVEIFLKEWVGDKDYLKTGWEVWEKVSWNREEVQDLITKLMHQIHRGEITCDGHMVDIKVSPEQWLNKNLCK